MLEIKELIKHYEGLEPTTALLEKISLKEPAITELRGTSGSSQSVIASFAMLKNKGVHVFIRPDKESAAYFQNDLLALLDDESVYFFPSSYKRSVQFQQTEPSNIILRTAVLNQIAELEGNANNHQPTAIVTYPEALVEKVLSTENLKENTLKLIKNENISITFIEEVLQEYGFVHADFVYEPGQYSIRGSIVDIFSFSDARPYRIDFFGDEVESIRAFDVETQLSKKDFSSITIVPNLSDSKTTGIKKTFLEYLPKESTLWMDYPELIFDKVSSIYESTGFEQADKTSQLAGHDELKGQSNRFNVIITANNRYYKPAAKIEYDCLPQPAFNKNFDLLVEDIKQNKLLGYTTYILSDNEKQFDRLNTIFESLDADIHFEPVYKTLHQGFIDQSLRILVYTDHQIFDRYHKFKINRSFDKKATLTLKELTSLNPGDYVVHVDHGIGIFGGMDKIEVNGRQQESIRLIFRDQDVLYVSIHSLHRISKYKGKEGEQPKIYKLGSGAWQKLKQKTKKKVKDIAKDLIALYAQRKAEQGFAFAPDTYLQNELEASFIYEDTPDQEKATKTVKEGMESSYPMDCLVCGDVGFGKTEVAIRAAFKAVTDNKQVAILVPTTILALQHYRTFSERLKDFPCTIDYISRLKKPAAQRETLKHLSEGKLDIIIGTHRLVGKDVKFKDLGLLIIDEEQKFGVAVKEKLKTFKVNVDTLTLTATPIPRTLQFSLMGARDLAIINTPPPNRHPIITEVHILSEEIIAEGIQYEMSRGGQVFFIHNRVQNILEVETLINRTVPQAKTVVAHGQMEGPKLEKIMLDFISGDYDVLIATSIIESGLDIPNANTIFINNAHHFGLSDLHQLRGRVGRSNRKAFCYLLAPPVTVQTPEARRRLKAIEEFSELGSGFNIAMQDLDIRGAGDLLGAEQSGFITDIGLETYQRILNEAMLELRENEYKELFSSEKATSDKEGETSMEIQQFVSDCIIDTDLELLFPDSYIENITERLRLYRQLDNINETEELEKFEQMLEDRFGPLPKPTKELMQVVRLRWLGNSLGMEKIILKYSKMVCHFVSNQESGFYQSPVFTHILQFFQENPTVFSLKETREKLTITAERIDSVSNAIQKLSLLNYNNVPAE